MVSFCVLKNLKYLENKALKKFFIFFEVMKIIVRMPNLPMYLTTDNQKVNKMMLFHH